MFKVYVLLAFLLVIGAEATSDEHMDWWLRQTVKYHRQSLDDFKDSPLLSPEDLVYRSRDPNSLKDVIDMLQKSPYIADHPSRNTIIDIVRVMWRFPDHFPIAHLAGFVFVDEHDRVLIIHNIRDHQEPSCYFDAPVLLYINLPKVESLEKWVPAVVIVLGVILGGSLLLHWLQASKF